MKKLIKRSAVRLISEAGYFIKPHIENRDDSEHYIKLFGLESVEKRRFYNISAGGHFDFGCGIHHPCWTNVDMDRKWRLAKNYDPERDIAHDLLTCTPIPIESNSAEIVHSRLTIEHITDEAVLYMFKEVKRILKKGAIFRVHTINTDLDYRALKNNDREFFFWFRNNPSISLEQAFLEHFAANASTLTPDGAENPFSDEEIRSVLATMKYEDALDYFTSRCPVELQNKYRNRHMNWWNPEKLHRMLASAGFKTIYLSQPEQSASPVLRNDNYFDNMTNRTMLYMEAVND